MRTTPAVLAPSLVLGGLAPTTALADKPADQGKDTPHPRTVVKPDKHKHPKRSKDLIQIKLKEGSKDRVDGEDPVKDGSPLAALQDSGVVKELRPWFPPPARTFAP